MKKLLSLIFLQFITIGLYAHPKPFTLNTLIENAKYIVSGEIISVEPYAFTLRLDSVYYGDYQVDTIRITEPSPSYPEWTHRIDKGYKTGDRKLVFVGIYVCEEIEYTSIGIFLEGEISIYNDSVKWNEQMSSLDNFLNAISSYRNLIENTPDKINDTVFCQRFSAISFVHANLIENRKKSLITEKVLYEPGPVSPVLAATKMNVLYLGVDNPLQLAFDNTDTRELMLSTNNGTLTNYGNGYYNMRPDSLGNANIYISRSLPGGSVISLGEHYFRVKKLPDPVPTMAGVSGGTISKNVILASVIIPKNMNYDFDINYRLISFNMSTSLDQEVFMSCNNMLTEKMKAKINELHPGDQINFYDIKVIGPDKLLRDIGSMAITVK